MFGRQKLLLVGYGKMGSSFVHPLRKAFDLTVVDPVNKPTFECTHLSSVSELSGHFDYLIFAVKPFQLMEVLGEFREEFLEPQSRIISLIAGAKSHVYRQTLGENVKVSLAMANLPVRVGKGVTALYSDEKLEFMDLLGQTIYVKTEEEIGTNFNKICFSRGAINALFFTFLSELFCF